MTTSKPISFLFAASLLAAPHPSFAQGQKSSDDAEEVVVTAARRPLDLVQVGSSISVITAEEIEARQYTFVLDAVESLPGVTINQNGPFGGVATARIRGAGSDQSLVLIDGVVVGDPSSTGGGFNFARLNVADVERIEVLKGPQSTLYGSDAIGGVINIITKKGVSGAPSLFASLEGGSFGTVSGNATLSGASDIFDYRVTTEVTRTGGISKADEDDGNTEDDGFRTAGVSANLGANLLPWLRSEVSGRYFDTRSEYDSFGVVTGVQDGDEVDQTEEWQASGRLIGTFFDGKFRNELTAGFSKIDRAGFSNGAFSFGSIGERLSFEYLGTADVHDKISVLFGAESEETRLKNATENQDILINSVFGEVRVTPVDGLVFSAGVRHDNHDTFGGATTARVTGVYNHDATGTILRASWGEGFKAPTPFQLTFVCCGFPGPASDLQPEESEGWDIGLEQDFQDGKATVSVTYFSTKSVNQIAFIFADGGYVNFDRARSRGVEVAASAAVTDWLSIDANYSHIDAENLTTAAALIRVPRNTAAVTATVRPTDAVTVTPSITYNGEEPDPRGVVPSWTRVDIRAAYSFTSGVEVFGRIENLLDANYQEIFGYGTPGISAYAGIRGRF